MVAPTLLFWLSLADPLLIVEGNAACPTPQEVADRVAALLPVQAPPAARDTARIDRTRGALRVQLQRPDGRIVGTRLLDQRFACADLASAAAVVVVTWESDVHPEFLRNLPRPPPAPPSETITAAPPPPPAPPRANPMAFDVGLGLAGSLAPSSASGADAAWGGLVAVAFFPTERPLGLRMAFQADSERALALPSGDARWRRLMLSLGADLRLAWRDGRWLLDLHAGALGSRVSTHGAGFVGNLSAGAFEGGAVAGIRLTMRRAVLAPWLELTAAGWPQRQIVFEGPSMTSRALPRQETTLALGVSLFLGR